MAFSKVEEGTSFFRSNTSIQNQPVFELAFKSFKKLIKSHIALHFIFLFVFLVEIGLWTYFFSFFSQSFVLSLSLAFIFLTIFSYFILKFYFKAKKPEQIEWLVHDFAANYKTMINYSEGNPEDYITLANAYCKYADFLDGQEKGIYSTAKLKFMSKMLNHFSVWCHWHDFYLIKEMLLNKVIEENIKLVKCEPTSLEVHASLANAYVMLSGLYINPSHLNEFNEDSYSKYDKIEFEQKFRIAAERAIEEFKILRDYAPNDPWVHSQLAYSYHDLKMPEEEIKEYETLLTLNPGEPDSIFKLGMLYFQQGANAKGLRMYDQLKKINYKKAEDLIKFYGVPFERK